MSFTPYILANKMTIPKFNKDFPAEYSGLVSVHQPSTVLIAPCWEIDLQKQFPTALQITLSKTSNLLPRTKSSGHHSLALLLNLKETNWPYTGENVPSHTEHHYATTENPGEH